MATYSCGEVEVAEFSLLPRSPSATTAVVDQNVTPTGFDQWCRTSHVPVTHFTLRIGRGASHTETRPVAAGVPARAKRCAHPSIRTTAMSKFLHRLNASCILLWRPPNKRSPCSFMCAYPCRHFSFSVGIFYRHERNFLIRLWRCPADPVFRASGKRRAHGEVTTVFWRPPPHHTTTVGSYLGLETSL